MRKAITAHPDLHKFFRVTVTSQERGPSKSLGSGQEAS